MIKKSISLSMGLLLACLVVPYLGLIHYLLPVRHAATEFKQWPIFILSWLIFWILWVPLIAYLLELLVRSIQTGRSN